MRTVILAVLLLAATSVHATADPKRPAVAAALAIVPATIGLFGFVASVEQDDPPEGAVAVSAMVVAVGPSLGHFYTGSNRIGLLGIAARVGGFALYRKGAGECTDPEAYDQCGPRVGQNKALEYAGLTLLVGGTVAQLIDAPLSAKRHDAGLLVVPTAAPGRVGLALGGTF